MNNSNYHFNARGTYINFIGFFIKLMQLSKNFIPKNLIISRIDDEMVNIELDLQITYEND